MRKHLQKAQGKKSLFDEQFTIERLSEIGNPLEAISKVIDFEMFRSTIEDKLLNTNKKSNAGAKPFDVVMMFKLNPYPSIGLFSNDGHQKKVLISF